MIALPAHIRVIERGWLSSNNIVLFDGDAATLIDSGYVAHAAQTLALVDATLAGRPLAQLINTHSHSDHIGGNAALVRAHGCGVAVPAGMAAAVERWDTTALQLATADQRAEPFAVDATIEPGAWLEFGELAWHALAAPGHDMDALMFHAPDARILISGDALWQDGFGILFADVLGEGAALAAAQATLERIARLDVDVVIPGHGAPFVDVDAALERAFGRVRAFREEPARIARNALRACVSFNFMDLRRMPRAGFAAYLQRVPLFREANARYLGLAPGALAQWLEAELLRAGTLRIDGDDLVAV